MRRKRCRCCRKFYWPRAQSYRQQKVCCKESCQAWRKGRAQKAWSLKNAFYWESCKGKQKLWRGSHPNYWREWRKSHPGYVRRNRLKQKRRDAQKRGFLAKQDGWNAVCVEKLGRIASLRDLAKQDGWTQVQSWQIDSILKYLKGKVLLAKQDDIDKMP